MLNNKKNIDNWTYITVSMFILYTIFLMYPLFSLLINSFIDGKTGEFTLEFYQRFFNKRYYYNTLLNSFYVTISVTLLSILIATPLAYIMSTIKIKGSSF